MRSHGRYRTLAHCMASCQSACILGWRPSAKRALGFQKDFLQTPHVQTHSRRPHSCVFRCSNFGTPCTSPQLRARHGRCDLLANQEPPRITYNMRQVAVGEGPHNAKLLNFRECFGARGQRTFPFELACEDHVLRSASRGMCVCMSQPVRGPRIEVECSRSVRRPHARASGRAENAEDAGTSARHFQSMPHRAVFDPPQGDRS